MLRKSSTPNFEEIRSGGIGFASKLVIEYKYDAAKDVFEKYELSVYPNGEFLGKPEDAFLASAVYLYGKG